MKSDYSNPEDEEMSDSDDEDKGKDEHEVRFTADGLMYVDKVVGKVGEEKDQVESESDGDH